MTTKGFEVLAWTQCIAIDASVAGTIIRTLCYHAQGERMKCLLNGFLSVLQLFAAAIISNIESVQQTLNLILEMSYMHVFILVELLIRIRSIVIVLLIVVHALRHVHHEPEPPAPTAAPVQPSMPVALTLELVDALRGALVQVRVTEEPQRALLSLMSEQEASGGEHPRA